MATVYLLPTVLDEEGFDALPSYLIDRILSCQAFYTENERTTRRYFKKLKKEIVIDEYRWYTIGEPSQETRAAFKKDLQENNTIAITSEAGCPGVADPGQHLVAIAQDMKAKVIPLVGPNSILLALMASGMNGQHFNFVGYLPVDNNQRQKKLKELETDSRKSGATQIFIETPYRNDAMFDSLMQSLQPQTKLCIAAELTGRNESVITMKIEEWKKQKPGLHKRPVIFLISA